MYFCMTVYVRIRLWVRICVSVFITRGAPQGGGGGGGGAPPSPT